MILSVIIKICATTSSEKTISMISSLTGLGRKMSVATGVKRASVCSKGVEQSHRQLNLLTGQIADAVLVQYADMRY